MLKKLIKKANEKEKLKKKIKDLERQIKIKDAWCSQIYAIGFDYDGYHKAESLKKLIDELVDYSTKAINCDDKSVVYHRYDSHDVQTKVNILLEEVGGSNE